MDFTLDIIRLGRTLHVRLVIGVHESIGRDLSMYLANSVHDLSIAEVKARLPEPATVDEGNQRLLDSICQERPCRFCKLFNVCIY